LRGIEFSQWGGPLDAGTVECWKSRGVEFAVVQYSAESRAQMDVLQQAGIKLEGYIYLYWGVSPWNQTPAQRTRLALATFGDRITRLWLDAEDSTNPYDENQLLECVKVCEDAGMPVGIYTGGWWWKPNTGDSKAFSHLVLWDANYLRTSADADAEFIPDLASWKPYGGWTKPEIWQYQGTSTLCGYSVDMNYMFVEAEKKEEIPDMKWVALKDRPDTTIFRSYLVWADQNGLHARFVPDYAEHEALDESKVAGDLQFVSIETLRQFKCQPDPLS
jgi:hypothetical protein